MIIIGLVFTLAATPAFATSINFSQCYANANHHCYQFSPQLNAKSSSAPNWHVEIHLPQNGAAVLDQIFSDDNYTALKNNPAVMAVVNIYTTTSPVSINYCPIAKYILTNQGTPEYLNHFYNITANKDLTGFIYPAYCHMETGANPIDGDNSNPSVPEFGPVASLVLVIAIVSVIAVTARSRTI